MKAIGLVPLALGLLLAAVGLLAMWLAGQSIAASPETPRPSDLASRINIATLIAVPGIPIGVSLAVAGLALFLGGLFVRDSKAQGP
jgi:hypothetical protein